ncbi:MAG: SDR family NAD(P)-dependent oxidoreductase [Runella sp.]
MFDLSHQTVIITGGAGGLGRAFALGFARQGANVAVADLNLKGAEETAEIVGGNALALQVDVTDPTSTQNLIDEVSKHFGRIDILLNNAAIYATIERKPFYQISDNEWERVLNVNLKGVWQCSKAFVNHHLNNNEANPPRSIINISSATVMSGSPFWSHYVASKGGVIGLTRTMAKELGDFNITVNAIAPGFTLTDASLGLIENAAQYGVERGAIKRPSTAEDIVGTALYLASPAARFVTGQTIVVDGGKQFI